MLLAVLVLGPTGVAQERIKKEKPAKKDATKGKSLVARGAEVKKLAGDFKFTEGSVSDNQGNVYFSDIPNDRILRWSLDGKPSAFVSLR